MPHSACCTAVVQRISYAVLFIEAFEHSVTHTHTFRQTGTLAYTHLPTHSAASFSHTTPMATPVAPFAAWLRTMGNIFMLMSESEHT